MAPKTSPGGWWHECTGCKDAHSPRVLSKGEGSKTPWGYNLCCPHPTPSPGHRGCEVPPRAIRESMNPPPCPPFAISIFQGSAKEANPLHSPVPRHPRVRVYPGLAPRGPGGGGQAARAVCPAACECPIQGCAKCIGSGTLADSWDPSPGQGGSGDGAGFTPAGGLQAPGGLCPGERGSRAPGRGARRAVGRLQGQHGWGCTRRGPWGSPTSRYGAGQALPCGNDPRSLPKGGCTPAQQGRDEGTAFHLY